MINITLPDGSVRQYDKGITSMQIALSISEGLARNVLAAEVRRRGLGRQSPHRKRFARKIVNLE
jgi:hypothetical protein